MLIAPAKEQSSAGDSPRIANLIEYKARNTVEHIILVLIKVSRLQPSYDLVLSQEASWMIRAASVHPDYWGAASSAGGKSIPINSELPFVRPLPPAFVTPHCPPIMLIPPGYSRQLKPGSEKRTKCLPRLLLLLLHCPSNCSTVKPSSWLPHHATIQLN